MCAVAHVRGNGFGWHYFVTGSEILTSPHGLDLYATHAQLQIGPLTFVVVVPLVELLPAKIAEGVSFVLMIMAGIVLLRIIERMSFPRLTARGRARVLAAGVLMLGVWAEVAVHAAHPDDVLALLGVFGALYLFRRERAVLAALLLALAVDAKPWALLFAPMLLLAPAPARARAIATYAVVVTAAWLPFFVAAPASLHAGQFQIPVSPASVLHLFGVRGGTPGWCRPAQILLGAAAVGIAIRRRRWYAIALVGVCARMLLDPATKNYYDSGLLAASSLYDLAATETLVPLMSLTAAALVWLPSYAMSALPVERGVLRLGFLVVAPWLAVGAPRIQLRKRRSIEK